MERRNHIAVVGAGVAGLCAAVYALKSGYDVDVFEQHESAGGLATSWKRGDYTFENSLVWLLGSRPGGLLHDTWREVFDIDALTFVDQDEYLRIETESGESLSVYRDVDRMEAGLLERAPQDAEEIRHLASIVRRFPTQQLPDSDDGFPHAFLQMLRAAPVLPALHWWSDLTLEEFSKRFTSPILRSFVSDEQSAHLSSLAIVAPLAWMNDRNAGYPIGGSQSVTRPIVAEIEKLGGRIHTQAAVETILVERDTAVGVQLADNQEIRADWVIGAADGHETIYELLGGRYTDASIDELYGSREVFPSYLEVCLGVARDLSDHGASVVWVPAAPIQVDPGTSLSRLTMRFFHFDPTFAPAGKTAVTCTIPTRNVKYWTSLERDDPSAYATEKQRVADSVIRSLEKRIPDLRSAIDVVDVSTPATVIRCTRNWKGSMEGWLPTPGSGFSLPNTLPRLQNFVMAGQWVAPGGGFPLGLVSARRAVRHLCKRDGAAFLERSARV